MIDTHCHPNSPELRGDARGLMDRARDAGVRRMIIVGCDAEDSAEAVSMAREYAGYGTFAAVGIHPHEAGRYPNGVPESLTALFSDERVVAMGEIGLDYHYDISPRDVQIKMFELQLDIAAKLNVPVILHIRDAMSEALAVLRNFSGLRLLFHCYAGGLEYLDTVLGMGGICAIGGAVTWKNSVKLREVAARIPLDRLVLETDCPYMTPAPFRGRTNEPSYVKYVYEAVASARNMDLDELKNVIWINAERFFGT